MYQFLKKTVTAKDLAAVDDHVTESLLGTDEFTDDDAHQAQPNVDLHDGEQVGDVGRQHDLEQDMCGIAVECPDELDLIGGGFHKAGV